MNKAALFALAGAGTTIIFYLLLMAPYQVYLDNAAFPIWQKFFLYELFLLAIVFFFGSTVTLSLKKKVNIHTLRYSIAVWAFYHFLDYSEPPVALTFMDTIVKTQAWSLSSDTLGASLFCKCTDAINTLVCNPGCFNIVSVAMPMIFLITALVLFGPELSKFIKKTFK